MRSGRQASGHEQRIGMRHPMQVRRQPHAAPVQGPRLVASGKRAGTTGSEEPETRSGRILENCRQIPVFDIVCGACLNSPGAYHRLAVDESRAGRGNSCNDPPPGEARPKPSRRRPAARPASGGRSGRDRCQMIRRRSGYPEYRRRPEHPWHRAPPSNAAAQPDAAAAFAWPSGATWSAHRCMSGRRASTSVGRGFAGRRMMAA